MDFKLKKQKLLDFIDLELGFIKGLEILEKDGLTIEFNNNPILNYNINLDYNEIYYTLYYYNFLNNKTPENELNIKILDSLQIISESYNKHKNNLFLGYSGGKDSKIIKYLTKMISNNIILIHNSCNTEINDCNENIIEIKSPKSNFKPFLDLVNLKAQIDGTRKCEKGKSVIFNGVSIERNELNEVYNPKGVFSLEIYYPILFWSDRDVWTFIRKYNLMTESEIFNYRPSQPYNEIYL